MNVWPFSMTLRSTNLARTLPRNSTEMSRNPFKGSTENTELQDYMIGANSTTTNCSPQVTHPLHLNVMVCPKYIKLTAPMSPIVSACGMATYQVAKFLTKILQRYMGITPSFVKDSKSFNDHLRLVNISDCSPILFTNILCSCLWPLQAQTKGQLEILFIIVYSVAQCSNNPQSILISQFKYSMHKWFHNVQSNLKTSSKQLGQLYCNWL